MAQEHRVFCDAVGAGASEVLIYTNFRIGRVPITSTSTFAWDHRGILSALTEGNEEQILPSL